MKKKLLIIGSSGFFGQSIIDFLENSKSFDNFFSTIYLISRKNKNKISTKLKKKFEFVQIKEDLVKIKKLPFSDYIIYSALSNNLSKDRSAVKNYINLAKKFHKGSVIIYTSSGAVYGDQPSVIRGFRESSALNYQKQQIKYKRDYAKTKLYNEKKFKTLVNYNIKIIIARCFTFVGKKIPLNDKFIIGNIIRNIIKKRTIKIQSNHSVIRSYMHTYDLSDIFFRLFALQKRNLNIYNIGSDDPIDLHLLVKKLSLIFNLNYKFHKNIDYKNEDRYIPNIQKFRKEYKFNKKIDSINAILKTINELKNDNKKFVKV